MGIYTVHSDVAFDKRISNDIDILVKNVLSGIKGVRSIYLCGGFGRGEGSVLKKDHHIQPINDYDLVVFNDKKESNYNLDRIRSDLSKLCRIRQVDISVIHHKSINSLNFSMHNYDLIYASKLIYGKHEEAFKEIVWDPSKLPLKEGLTPLFLFLSSILKPFPIKESLSDQEVFWSYHQICKSILGWSTAQLVFEHAYVPSYAKRYETYQQIFSNDEKACSLVNKATQFKLSPNLRPCNEVELQNIWNLAKTKHLEILISLLGKFYGKNQIEFESLTWKHFNSISSIAKRLLSFLARKHHYGDCLNIDMSKLFLLLSIENNNDITYLQNSISHLKKSEEPE